MRENSRKYQFELGNFRVATLLAGTRTVTEDPQETFGMNVPAEAFSDVSRRNFIPDDWTQFFFTPTLVDTGEQKILFDAGVSAEGTLAALDEAGCGADEIDLVVLSHMHGDHIAGLSHADGTVTFPRATYMAGRVEFDAWSKREDAAFDSKVPALLDRMTFLEDGEDVAPGVTAIAAFGHTPGHMTFMLESEGERLLLMVDVANHYVWSLAHPEWEVRFDMDKAQAAKTRRRVLDMLASERIPTVGHHMPFPSVGFVEKAAEGTFRWVPLTYQFML